MKSKINASYTLEATLLFPTILFILISFIYFSFYLHDRVRLESFVNRILLESKDYTLYSKELGTGKINYNRFLNKQLLQLDYDGFELENEIEVYAYNTISKEFFIGQTKDLDILIKKDAIIMNVTLDIHIPIQAIRILLGKGSIEINYENRVKLIDKSNQVRKIQITMGIARKIDEVDKWLLELRELLH